MIGEQGSHAGILGGLGFKVLQAGDGREAVEMLNREADGVELVLSDWNMPEMNVYGNRADAGAGAAAPPGDDQRALAPAAIEGLINLRGRL